MEEKRDELEHLLRILNVEAKKYGLAINIDKKTKTMIFGGEAMNRT